MGGIRVKSRILYLKNFFSYAQNRHSEGENGVKRVTISPSHCACVRERERARESEREKNIKNEF